MAAVDRAWLAGLFGTRPDLSPPDPFPRRLCGRQPLCREGKPENRWLPVQGSIFTNLVVRNLRVVPTGPTIVESIDVDYIRADYSLWDFARRGATEVLKNAEIRTAAQLSWIRPKPRSSRRSRRRTHGFGCSPFSRSA